MHFLLIMCCHESRGTLCLHHGSPKAGQQPRPPAWAPVAHLWGKVMSGGEKRPRSSCLPRTTWAAPKQLFFKE